MNIYVGNLPWKVTSKQLSDLFEVHGAVESARIIRDKETKRSKGYGFVVMQDDDSANTAIEALNGQDLEGRALNITPAKPREDSNQE